MNTCKLKERKGREEKNKIEIKSASQEKLKVEF